MSISSGDVHVERQSTDSNRDAQMHIYDEVPRETEPEEEEGPVLPPKTTRSSSDKKNNNDDTPVNTPVNLALSREEELLLLRKKKYEELIKAQRSNRGLNRHESAPARNGFPHIVKRRAETMQDGVLPGDPDYQDPDDFRYDDLAFKSNLKTQSSLPCIPAVSTYAEADQGQHESLGFNCDDEGDYWSIPREYTDSGDYAEWPAAITPSHSNYGKPFAQSTLKKQMSTSTTSSSRTDSSMVDIKTYEDSISSADSPDLPKKLNNRPVPKSRTSYRHLSKIVVHEKEIQVNPRDLPEDPCQDICTQTLLEVKDCCSCGDMVYISDDAFRLRDLLRFEQSQRLMAEQLFKLAEREVIDLQGELDEEKKITERLSTDLIKTKDTLKEVDRLGTESRTRSEDLRDQLNDANDRISKLEEELAEANQQRQDVQKMLDTKLSQHKSKNAENNTTIEMLQADLLQCQQEINRLLERLADVNREKSEMVSNEVHSELLRMSDDRAKRAEMRAMSLEHELRTLRQQYNNSHNETDMYPMVKVYPDKSGKRLPERHQEYPPMLPPRGGFDYTGFQGNRPRNVSSPASPHMFRKNNEMDTDQFDRSRPADRNAAAKTAKDKMRSQSKSPKRNARITTKMSRAQSQGASDTKNRTFLDRVQNKMDPKSAPKSSSPKSTHKTFLDRVQSRFFASKKKDAVTPCDLPDINTLMQYAVKAEYETPSEYMKNYTGTPLIDQNNLINRTFAETDDSDWSETDDELLDPGVKKAKREKIQQNLAKTKERHRANKEAAERAKAQKEALNASRDTLDSQEDDLEDDEGRGGSQKSKGSGKPPPPVAPKPKKSSTNNSVNSLNSTGSQGSQTKTNSTTDATSRDKVESTESLNIETKTPASSPEDDPSSSPGREAPISFDESVPQKPQLKSYRRVQGPQGRRRPQRYSSQTMSQTMSTTLSQIMA